MTFKQKFNLSFIGFITVLALLGIVWLKARNSNEPKVIKPIEFTRRINQAGDSVVSLKGTPEQFGLRDNRVADSIAKMYDIKLKNLQEYIIAYTQSRSDIPGTPGTREIDYFPDTTKNCPPVIRNMRQQFNTPWDSITVQIGDSSYLKKRSFDTLTAIWHSGKEGKLFNRTKYLQLEISFADTSRHITGATAFRTRPQKQNNRLAISLQAGYGLSNRLKPAPYIGAGISYTLFKL